MDVLDNPAWHSLALQPNFAQLSPQARRYLPAVDPLAALSDGAPADAWAELRPLMQPGEAVHLLQPSLAAPDGWEVRHRGRVVQMVGVDAALAEAAATDEVLELTDEDGPEMLQLALATQPGPFAERTHELGRFIGVRDEGRLVAMAGERFLLDGMTEVSAVCTDPAYRGRGLAAALTATIAASIYSRGEVPFLHVVEANATARGVYERIGFADRVTLDHLFVSPAGS